MGAVPGALAFVAAPSGSEKELKGLAGLLDVLSQPSVASCGGSVSGVEFGVRYERRASEQSCGLGRSGETKRRASKSTVS